MTDNIVKPEIIDFAKPWGNYRLYVQNKRCTVKVLTVNPHQMLSKQSHENRDEVWTILDVGLRVELEDQILDTEPGQLIFIPRGTKHRLISNGITGRVLEVSFGWFEEEDVERYDDIYGRT